MPYVPQRTRISNGKLALIAGVCIAMVGLAPVAHMMFSPASRVSLVRVPLGASYILACKQVLGMTAICSTETAVVPLLGSKQQYVSE
jgi:hypothetical protein